MKKSGTPQSEGGKPLKKEVRPKIVICDRCGGTGEVYVRAVPGDRSKRVCPVCDGLGESNPQP